MGKSSNFKSSGTPERAYPNEFEYNRESLSGGEVQKNRSKLIINLVQIDKTIASKTALGDSVSIMDKGPDIEVHTAKGRIGNIPVHDQKEVRAFNYSEAFISGMKTGSYQVQITLRG